MSATAQKAELQTREVIADADLPEGWDLPSIGEVLTVNYGKGLKEADRVPGETAVFGSNGVVGRHRAALTCGPTIIIGRKGTIGAIHFSPRPCWPIDTTYFIDDFHGLDPIYVTHALRSLNLGEHDTSTAIPGLNRDDLYAQKISLAPLTEQKRIVAKIEELLTQVNAARARVAKVPVILKRFRQAVLAAACSGRLTEDWRTLHPSIQPADKVLNHVLDLRRTEWRKTSAGQKGQARYNEPVQPDVQGLPDLPLTWCWATVNQLASPEPRSIQSGPFGSHLHHSEFQSSGILAIGIDNVLEGDFSLGKRHRISQAKYESLKKFTARPNDVLMTVMATVGRCCVIPENIETAIITKHVYRITVDRLVGEPRFLMFALRGDVEVQNHIQSQIRGQTRPGINGEILKGVAIPTPPLDEQQEIVRRVGALLKLADTVEKRVAVATKRAEKLTQAILAKAFRGELAPTEAELARREGRGYEPASALLARIHTERAVRDVKSPTRGKGGQARPQGHLKSAAKARRSVQ